MLPEPIEIPQNESLSTISTAIQNPRNHGPSRHDRSLSRSPPQLSTKQAVEHGTAMDSSSWSLVAERADQGSPRALKAGAGDKLDDDDHDGNEEEGKALKSLHLESRNDKGKVLTRNTGSPISKLPNETLTHVLSHLSPESLSAVSLVSKRFHNLVTTPHAWRLAFARFFAGPTPLLRSEQRRKLKKQTKEEEEEEGVSNSQKDVAAQLQKTVKSDRRMFNRLTALASWRSEYIIRTRLLNSISRAKPGGERSNGKSNTTRNLFAINTSYSGLFSTFMNLQTNFSEPRSKLSPQVISGPDLAGNFMSSNVATSVVKVWAQGPAVLRSFGELYAGESQWGLGSGDHVGLPNFADSSFQYGAVLVEGIPAGLVYFLPRDEKRFRVLQLMAGYADLNLGIPNIPAELQTVTSVWIAKSQTPFTSSNGLLGMLVGDSAGILTAYSCGRKGIEGARLEKGEMTARWALSPGVPIVDIAVDDSLSSQRLAKNRVYAAVINALGECFYLTQLPVKTSETRTSRNDLNEIERLAWATGRSVTWKLIQKTRRLPVPHLENDLYNEGSYSPRSFSDEMGLSPDQIAAETREIEKYCRYKPIHFRNVCEGWNMKRKIVLDCTGSSGSSGESVTVIERASEEGSAPSVTRFTRCRIDHVRASSDSKESPAEPKAVVPRQSSIFGGQKAAESLSPTASFSSSSDTPASIVQEPVPLSESDEEWRESQLSFGLVKSVDITAWAVDETIYAQTCPWEDPLLLLSGPATSSSSSKETFGTVNLDTVPGQRARYFAIGTSTGDVVVWNLRAPISTHVDLINEIDPIRIIHTTSPKVTSLVLSALYLVHGGDDGLVQAWDPLMSTTGPLRTIHSRFSPRARQRNPGLMAQNGGVGQSVVGAICLAPDPTDLRGVVSIGNKLRYWHYSSDAADEAAGRKRRIRRGPRLSNSSASSPFTGTGRSAIEAFIEDERLEHQYEEKRKKREADKLAGRFGVGLLGHGESEEDVLAYAQLLSQESFQQEEDRRQSESEYAWSSVSNSDSQTRLDANSEATGSPRDVSPDLSFADSDAFEQWTDRPEFTFKRPSSSRQGQAKKGMPSPPAVEDDLDGDIAYALQLSLAEERSRAEHEAEVATDTKGKGRAN